MNAILLKSRLISLADMITIFACGHAPTPEQGLILFRRSLMLIRAFIRPVWADLLSVSVALGSETGICWVAQKKCINIVPQTLDQSTMAF